ncbi:N-acetylneuraminate synthase family protein [Sulfurospirillum sp. 1307]|jgi:sialic acid synthase SpsE
MKTIKTKNREIGGNKPAYIIAEIGSNHNNDFDIALEMIDKAKEAGVDAVKFQTFKAENHYSKFTPKHSQHKKNIHELIKELEIDRNWHKKLKNYCDKIGIDFFTSPCDFESIDEMLKLEVPFLKVASFDLTDLKLIEYMAKTKIPLILSTGLATLSDIENAVNTSKKAGNDNIALLQCTSLYPAPAKLSNLNAMKTMQLAFDCVIGYSDHTIGDHIPIAAVTLGAKIIEKHYTLDRTMKGPDHSFAIEPNELKDMVKKIRDIEVSLGDGLKNGPREEEKENFSLRRSIIATRDLKKGEIITQEDLIIKRPGYGIEPKFYDIVIGREVKEDIKEDEWITWRKI